MWRDATGRSVKIKTAAGRGRELAYGEILVAAVRRPVARELNLDAAGVETGGRGEIVTGELSPTGSATRTAMHENTDIHD